MRFTSQERSDLTQFFVKGPVNYESVKRKMLQLQERVKPFFTKREWVKLMISQHHAYIGEGRQEWDEVCSEIKERWGWKDKRYCHG